MVSERIYGLFGYFVWSQIRLIIINNDKILMAMNLALGGGTLDNKGM